MRMHVTPDVRGREAATSSGPPDWQRPSQYVPPDLNFAHDEVN